MKPKPCPVCDDTRLSVLGYGQQADFYDCPACVGLRREYLFGEVVLDATHTCDDVGLSVKWLPDKGTEG